MYTLASSELLDAFQQLNFQATKYKLPQRREREACRIGTGLRATLVTHTHTHTQVTCDECV